MISLVHDTIDKKDIDSLINWLKTYPRLTKGNITEQFEKKWALFTGSDNSVFVNSGSSANLLMLYTLMTNGDINIGDSVIVPALSWATDLAPIMQLGLNPILCDCNLEDLSIDLDELNILIRENKNIKAIMFVSILGLVPDMERLQNICNKNKIIILEDVCESLGSKFKEKQLGTFGTMSSFSTYFGHHLSTIEGGLVCTNNTNYKNLLKSLRSHGWDRDLDNDYKQSYRKSANVSNFDSLYTFYYPGFNFRPTDLQAFLGLGQLKKAIDVINNRNNNYLLYKEYIKNDLWKPIDRENTFVSNFAYPLIVSNKEQLVEIMITNNIECRPILSRSMGIQPMYTKKYGYKKFKNSNLIDKCGFYIPNHQNLSENDIHTISNLINNYAK